MELTFTALFEEIPEEQGGGFVATVEELPEAISEGKTLEEARANLRDAIELVLQDNRERFGKPVAERKVIREPISITLD